MDGLGTILSYTSIIVLGYVLRRCNVLKADTVHALAGLILYVTVPSLVLVNLNGVQIDPSFFSLIALGVFANLIMVGVGYVWQRKNLPVRTFSMINLAGYNIGTFAMPLMQSFVSPMAFLSICMFDVGNALMCTGTTYALATGEGNSKLEFAKNILKRMFASGPIIAYLTMTMMAVLHWKFPQAVVDFATIAADANGFLAMIMLGQGINLSMRADQVAVLLKHLVMRVGCAAILACGFWFLLPYGEDVRKALAILAFAPIPAIALVFSIRAKCDVKMAANFNSLSVATSIMIVMAMVSVWY